MNDIIRENIKEINDFNRNIKLDKKFCLECKKEMNGSVCEYCGFDFDDILLTDECKLEKKKMVDIKLPKICFCCGSIILRKNCTYCRVNMNDERKKIIKSKKELKEIKNQRKKLKKVRKIVRMGYSVKFGKSSDDILLLIAFFCLFGVIYAIFMIGKCLLWWV